MSASEPMRLLNGRAGCSSASDNQEILEIDVAKDTEERDELLWWKVKNSAAKYRFVMPNLIYGIKLATVVKIMILAVIIIIMVIISLCVGISHPGTSRSASDTSDTSNLAVLDSELGFIVIPELDFIRFNPENPSSYQSITDELDDFISPYESAERDGKMINCYDNTPNATQVCLYKSVWLDDCNKESHWGYKDSMPCVVLTFSENSTFHLDEEVWVYCNDVYAYSPQQSYEMYYFLNKNVSGYLRPLIVLRFDMTSRSEITVQCSLWGRTNATGLVTAKVSFTLEKFSEDSDTGPKQKDEPVLSA